MLRDRLMTPMPDDRLWGWIGPLIVTAFAAFLRFNRLSVPDAVIFDETYYAKDAWSAPGLTKPAVAASPVSTGSLTVSAPPGPLPSGSMAG